MEHRQPVELDGRAADGRDISDCGLSVVVHQSIGVGEIVGVRHASFNRRDERVHTRARVVWRDVTPEGFLMGLEFVA